MLRFIIIKIINENNFIYIHQTMSYIITSHYNLASMSVPTNHIHYAHYRACLTILGLLHQRKWEWMTAHNMLNGCYNKRTNEKEMTGEDIPMKNGGKKKLWKTHIYIHNIFRLNEMVSVRYSYWKVHFIPFVCCEVT